jgi:RNA polymerase sporulation-specific sigma factor
MPISLYENSDNGDESSQNLIEKIPSGFDEEKLLDKIMFSSLIEKLPEREKKLIIMRFYRDKTQSETAKILGISQVQVSRLETKILEKFKSAI